MHEYDLIADWYASNRDDSTGLTEILSLAQSLPPHATVLDIGCGNGLPLARALLTAGHHVIGLDSSSVMLARFQANCPQATAIQDRIETHSWAAPEFDAAVAWGVLFHLTPQQQIQAISNVARALKKGAPFLFTAGDVEGFEGKPGVMNGVTFLYYSFTKTDYERLLEENGFLFTSVHADAGDNICYLAVRR